MTKNVSHFLFQKSFFCQPFFEGKTGLLFLFQIVFLFEEKYGTLGQVRINTTKFGARYTLLYFLSFCFHFFVLLFYVVKQKDSNKRIQTKEFKQKDSNKRIQTTKQQQKKEI